MARKPTNTLILTNVDKNLLDDPARLIDLIASQHYYVDLVSLPKFKRIILVCVSATVACHLRDFLESNMSPKPRISFALGDNRSGILEDDSWALQSTSATFLELPTDEGSRRFLISPPLSPQNEWNDYHKVEEGPNKKSIFSPDEISHLLWDRLGGFDSSQVRRFAVDSDEESDDESTKQAQGDVYDIASHPEVLFEDVTNGVPVIMVDKVQNRGKNKSLPLPKTTCPPVEN